MKNKNKSDSRITFLDEIFSLIDSVGDFDHLLEVIISTATNVTGAKASSLLLIDPKSGKLFFHIATGEKKEEIKRFELDPGKGIAGWVIKNKKPLLVKDVSKDSRWNNEISESIGFETLSIACVPLIVKNDIIGVIEIIDRVDNKPIHDEDIILLNRFAGFAASAIVKGRIMNDFNKENMLLRKELDDKYQIVGESSNLKSVLFDACKVATSKATTILYGESGTGKELIARLVHNKSPRRKKPFLTINCGAFPETLLERELFGHEKGAFTGADSMKIGIFEAANEGTLLLDEIGETSPAMQVKLLRVIQEGVFYRIGATTPTMVDVRIIASTNKDLKKMVTEGTFREDLYYRLNVVSINIPPLRERREDVTLLVNYFVSKKCAESHKAIPVVSQEAMKMMLNYRWPGNIRELGNSIERAIVMGDGSEINVEDLPLDITRRELIVEPTIGVSLKEGINKFKKDFVLRTLEFAKGDKNRTASILDIQRTYLYRLLRELEIET